VTKFVSPVERTGQLGVTGGGGGGPSTVPIAPAGGANPGPAPVSAFRKRNSRSGSSSHRTMRRIRASVSAG